MKASRIENDGLGPVEIPAERLWGPITARALLHFCVSGERVSLLVVRALAVVKRAAAVVNRDLGHLPAEKSGAIVAAADEVLAGRHEAEFRTSVWMPGSGESNMNMNEVLANRASELLGGERGDQRLVHPNDDVNHGQSSNDVFPTAMSIVCTEVLAAEVLPALRRLEAALAERRELGPEFPAFAAALASGSARLEEARARFLGLALGGTAVGTGLNCPPGFAAAAVKEIARFTGLPFRPAANRFECLATCDAYVQAHACLRGLAGTLHQAAGYFRSRGMGGEAADALAVCCAQVIGNDAAVAIAGAAGEFELNYYKPLVMHNFLQSCRLLGGSAGAFAAWWERTEKAG